MQTKTGENKRQHFLIMEPWQKKYSSKKKRSENRKKKKIRSRNHKNLKSNNIILINKVLSETTTQLSAFSILTIVTTPDYQRQNVISPHSPLENNSLQFLCLAFVLERKLRNYVLSLIYIAQRQKQWPHKPQVLLAAIPAVYSTRESLATRISKETHALTVVRFGSTPPPPLRHRLRFISSNLGLSIRVQRF